LKELSVVDFLNSFSVPVVLGSVSTSLFFARFFHADLPWVFYYLLGSTVWVIYTIDHVLDGQKTQMNSASLRHRIHYRYRTSLGLVSTLLIVANALIATRYLTVEGVFNGLPLALFVVVYFLTVHVKAFEKPFWWKEVFTAIGVTWGMAILPGLSGDLSFSISNVMLMLIFTCINFSNLLIFSYFDKSKDHRDGVISSAIAIPKEQNKALINNVLITAFALLCFWVFLIQNVQKLAVSMSFLMMINVLGMIVLQESRFKKNNLYRLWGDLIYLIPGIIWFLLRNKGIF
jgi:hypothetical protein